MHFKVAGSDSMTMFLTPGHILSPMTRIEQVNLMIRHRKRPYSQNKCINS
jgi:hypothetical protein